MHVKYYIDLFVIDEVDMCHAIILFDTQIQNPIQLLNKDWKIDIG